MQSSPSEFASRALQDLAARGPADMDAFDLAGVLSIMLATQLAVAMGARPLDHALATTLVSIAAMARCTHEQLNADAVGAPVGRA